LLRVIGTFDDVSALAPKISVVIPAHNESTVIDRCLSTLLAGEQLSEVQVIVVTNGCNDDTADKARAWGVEVIERDEPSKSAALVAGDAACRADIRAYVDADAVFSPGTLTAAYEALRGPGARAASPQFTPDASSGDWFVRSYASVWQQWPKWQHGQIGAGLYTLSAEGRARFTTFPNLFADDLFVECLFDSHERVTLSGVPAKFHMATSISSLLKVEARRHRARKQLDASMASGQLAAHLSAGTTFRHAETEPGWLGGLARNPRRWPALSIYVGVKSWSRFMARKSDGGAWVRDRT
jgi:glycosyltransferase involved in cell wall biosynthesis